MRKITLHIFIFFSIFALRPVTNNFLFADNNTNTTTPAVYPLGYYEDDPLPDKTVYLTFDDGPTDWTEGMLDTLKKYDIHATFFICGERTSHDPKNTNDFIKYKDTIIRMIEEGHVIGNHTLTHANLAELSPQIIAEQLDENQRLLNIEIGSLAPVMTLIRPPFGAPWFHYYRYSDAVKAKVGKIISSRGILVMWSRHFDSGDSLDWVKGDWYEKGPKINIGNEDFKKREQWIYDRLINQTQGKGMVILFHDTHLTTMQILPAIIEKLIAEGYSFATIEEYVLWKFGKSSKELITNSWLDYNYLPE